MGECVSRSRYLRVAGETGPKGEGVYTQPGERATSGAGAMGPSAAAQHSMAGDSSGGAGVDSRWQPPLAETRRQEASENLSEAQQKTDYALLHGRIVAARARGVNAARLGCERQGTASGRGVAALRTAGIRRKRTRRTPGPPGPATPVAHTSRS